MYEGIKLRVNSNSRARMSSYSYAEIRRHTCLSRLSWVSYTWFVWSLWTTEAPPSEEAAGKQNNNGYTCLCCVYFVVLRKQALMYHLKSQTSTELATSKVSNTCICQYIPFVGIGSKLQMGEGNNNQEVINFSKSKFQV